MRQFTNEELKALEQYESRFKTSMELNYVRNLEPRYLNAIKAIYDSAVGVAYPLNSTCSHCVLTFMKAVGTKYFNDLKTINLEQTVKATEDLSRKAERAAELVKALDEVMAEVPDEKPITKPKKTTKKNGKKGSNKK